MGTSIPASLNTSESTDYDMTKHRVLWLLNHTTLRRFEIEQLRDIGIEEVYTPKSFPYDEGNLSASVDYSIDANLTVTQDELDILNRQDWYASPSVEAWEIANRYFDVAIVGFFPEQLKSTVRNFKGAVILRAFGHASGHAYSKLLYQVGGERLVRDIRSLGRRFWFGAGYEHLHEVESNFLARRNCFLPVDLSTNDTSTAWTGSNSRILFICPRIGSSPYFENIYNNFKQNFGDVPYTIGGAQPVDVMDPHVIGYVSKEEHERNMREYRVMFYHSQEPNHIHYHPFEAVAAGMPLVFMAGGLLDRMGGKELPGRCKTINDAKKKIQKILNGDERIIRAIRSTQHLLLDAIKAENCAPRWQSSFRNVLSELEKHHSTWSARPKQAKKVAIVLPVEYKGGSLRGALLLAEAVRHGSAQADEAVDVVFLHLDSKDYYSEEDFTDMHPAIKRRSFHWKQLDAGEARRAMRYAGHEDWEPSSPYYLVVDDGIKQLYDCDLWLVISDRITAPILPLRPVVHMVYDYLQRYVSIMGNGADQNFLQAARDAEKVFVTTNFTRNDALQYAGVREDKVIKLPMLAPNFSTAVCADTLKEPDYFIWTTNASMHKNHTKALQALQFYYQQLDGKLSCKITGVGTLDLLRSPPAHLQEAIAPLKNNRLLMKHLTSCGNLSDAEYRRLLSNSAFLWHPATIDNGTFSVIEAASLGVPSLSSDYPPMREINHQFSLNLSWMNADDPKVMAHALKQMEDTHRTLRLGLPSAETLATQGVHKLSHEYWKATRECL